MPNTPEPANRKLAAAEGVILALMICAPFWFALALAMALKP